MKWLLDGQCKPIESMHVFNKNHGGFLLFLVSRSLSSVSLGAHKNANRQSFKKYTNENQRCRAATKYSPTTQHYYLMHIYIHKHIPAFNAVSFKWIWLVIIAMQRSQGFNRALCASNRLFLFYFLFFLPTKNRKCVVKTHIERTHIYSSPALGEQKWLENAGRIAVSHFTSYRRKLVSVAKKKKMKTNWEERLDFMHQKIFQYFFRRHARNEIKALKAMATQWKSVVGNCVLWK